MGYSCTSVCDNKQISKGGASLIDRLPFRGAIDVEIYMALIDVQGDYSDKLKPLTL